MNVAVKCLLRQNRFYPLRICLTSFRDITPTLYTSEQIKVMLVQCCKIESVLGVQFKIKIIIMHARHWYLAICYASVLKCELLKHSNLTK